MFVGFAVCVLAVASASPNIVWIWFDDLGIGDVSFMGGNIPTPYLDALVVDKSVKLNFHYSEPVCSPARSSFLTGRYAFKSGLNTAVKPFSSLGFNDQANVLLSQILKDSGSYNNIIAGKWHVGHDREARLPHSNGFNAGLYALIGADYWGPGFEPEELEDLDEAFGPEPYFDGPVQEARDALFPDGEIQMHHLYRLAKNKNGNGYAKSAQVEETVYNEDLYVDEIKSFIAAQDDSQNPFFVYYSLFTPHVPLAEPPLARNGEAVDYSVCTDAFPSDNGTCTDNLQCLYCSQIHYGSIGVQDIVDAIKNNPDIDWSNTVIIITSDNGPATAIGGAPGSAMPLRGRKSGVFEGGIRTPAFMIGGLVEQFTTNRCEYNEIVHVSDWYHVFMDMIDTVSEDYSPDADHSPLRIWQNIQCQCGGAADAVEKAQCNADNAPRTELITMITCSGSTPFMHTTAIIKDGYKLIVNGAVGSGRLCPSRFRNGAGLLTKYHAPPDIQYDVPNTDYYENWYQGVRDRMGSELFDTVFRSTCLEDLYENDTASMDNEQYPPFQYDTYLLFDLANDRVEGCALDLLDPINAAKKDELLVVLAAAAVEYDSPSTDVTPLKMEYAAFQSMIESFDCEEPGSGSVYLPSLWVDDPANLTNYETLWQSYIDEYRDCESSESDSSD